MRIMVTGANGLVGQTICDLLEKKSLEVIKLVSLRYPNNSLADKIYKVDIADKNSFHNIDKIGKIDAMIHTAGLAHQFKTTAKEDFWRVNVTGTQNVSELAINLKAEKFIQISSVSVYGGVKSIENRSVVNEESICEPADYYAESKLEGEKICHQVLINSDVNLTILRLATVIGEGDQGNVYRLIDSINRHRFLWIGKGENYKSLIYKADVAEAVLQILLKTTNKSEIYNLTSEAISMKKIVDTISENLKRKILPLNFPAEPVLKTFRRIYEISKLDKIKRFENKIAKWISNDQYSGEKFDNEFGFKPSVSIEEGLKREVNWYLQNK